MKGCKLLIDTNVIIDYAVSSRPSHSEAVTLFEEAAADKKVELLVPVSSLKDVYYVMCRNYSDEPTARQALRRITETYFTVIDLLAVYGRTALDSDEPDFEDGLVRAAAEAIGADAIVTRDAAVFGTSTVRCFTPAQATEFMRARRPARA